MTKGILPEQLEKWSQGSQFLRKPPEEWPKFEENALKINEELSAEMKPPIEARPTSGDKASTLRLQEPHLRIKKAFWIVGVRHMAKHLTGKCVTCKKLQKKPLEQLMVLVLLEKQRLKQQRQSMIDQFTNYV